MINEPEFKEGKLIYQVLRETNRSFHEEINKYKFEQLEYREYIEQVLYYARSTQVCKDYIVREFPLKDVINLLRKKYPHVFKHGGINNLT